MFKIKVDYTPNHFVGIDFTIHEDRIELHQRTYIEKIAKIFTISNSKVYDLYNTRTLKLIYHRNTNADHLTAFIDASHVSGANSVAPDSAHSISGGLVYFEGNLVDWGTKRQKIITRSTAAAEIVAVTDLIDSIRLINYLISSIYSDTIPATIYEDVSSTRTREAIAGGSDGNLMWIIIRVEDI